jgi:hypothetical protein
MAAERHVALGRRGHEKKSRCRSEVIAVRPRMGFVRPSPSWARSTPRSNCSPSSATVALAVAPRVTLSNHPALADVLTVRMS